MASLNHDIKNFNNKIKLTEFMLKNNVLGQKQRNLNNLNSIGPNMMKRCQSQQTLRKKHMMTI